MDLVILPFHDWRKCEAEGFRTRDGHLLQHFARHPLVRRLLVVNRPLTLIEMVLKRAMFGGGQKLKSYSIGPTAKLIQKSEKVFILDILSTDLISPIVLFRDWWFKTLSSRKVHRAIQKSIDFLGMNSAVLFLWTPMAAGVIGNVSACLIAFDAIDNWLRHPEIEDKRGFIARGYKTIAKNAEAIFVNSENLRDFFMTFGRESFLIKNGVDPERFNTLSHLVPPDIAAIKKPIVGYAGKLAKRIDVELIHYLADSLPLVSFVFIGQMLNRKAVTNLFNRPNVVYLGDKHYDLLPTYISQFDVAIIPHNVGRLENDGDPIKLYEYLAAGKPVVTSRIAGVRTFRRNIEIADSSSEFLQKLKKLLANPSTPDSAKKRRKLIGNEHTWKFKADQIVRTLIKLSQERTRLTR